MKCLEGQNVRFVRSLLLVYSVVFYALGIAAYIWDITSLATSGIYPWPLERDVGAEPVLWPDGSDSEHGFSDLQLTVAAPEDQKFQTQTKQITFVLRVMAEVLLVLGLLLFVIRICCPRCSCLFILVKYTPMVGGAVGVVGEVLLITGGANPGNDEKALSQVLCIMGAAAGITSGLLIALTLSADGVDADNVARVGPRGNVPVVQVIPQNARIHPSQQDYDAGLRADRNNPPGHAENNLNHQNIADISNSNINGSQERADNSGASLTGTQNHEGRGEA